MAHERITIPIYESPYLEILELCLDGAVLSTSMDVEEDGDLGL